MFTINDRLAGKLTPFPDLPTLRQRWDGMLARHAVQVAELHQHPDWLRLQVITDTVKLNAAVNALVKYTQDNWLDDWSTPLETLKVRAGDCEDYAILKMFLLKDARLVILHGLDVMHRDHAVCRIGNFYLDNRVDWLLLRTDLNGYSFEFEGVVS